MYEKETKAYLDGRNWGLEGGSEDENPFEDIDFDLYCHWLDGWEEGRAEIFEEN